MIRKWKLNRFVAVMMALLWVSVFVVPFAYAKGEGRGASGSQGPGFEPKGWDQGKKVGWHGKEQPPGLEKKATSTAHDNAKEASKNKKKHKSKDKKENTEAEKKESEKD